MATHDDFNGFALAVQCHLQAHPDWLRLNGEIAGGDQNAWAEFWHMNRKWKVDADTYILPILVAHEHWLATGANPFQIEQSPKRDCLVVIPPVRDVLISRDAKYRTSKYLYLYSPRED